MRVAAGGTLTLAIGHGVVVEAAGDTTLNARRSATGVLIDLDAGEVALSVAPQTGGRTVTVQTPQAAVHVVGTRFTVDHRGERTAVFVQQGRVQVTPAAGGASELVAGQRWESARRLPEPLWWLDAAHGVTPDGAGRVAAWSDRRPGAGLRWHQGEAVKRPRVTPPEDARVALDFADGAYLVLPDDATDGFTQGTLLVLASWPKAVEHQMRPLLSSREEGDGRVWEFGIRNEFVDLFLGRIGQARSHFVGEPELSTRHYIRDARGWHVVGLRVGPDGHALLLDGHRLTAVHAVGDATRRDFLAAVAAGRTRTWLGNTPGTTHQPFDGRIRELRLYGETLSDAEVAQVSAEMAAGNR